MSLAGSARPSASDPNSTTLPGTSPRRCRGGPAASEGVEGSRQSQHHSHGGHDTHPPAHSGTLSKADRATRHPPHSPTRAPLPDAI